MHIVNSSERGPSDPQLLRTYRVTVDAIAGCGRVFRHGQTLTDSELDGYAELFESWGALERLPFPAVGLL